MILAFMQKSEYKCYDKKNININFSRSLLWYLIPSPASKLSLLRFFGTSSELEQWTSGDCKVDDGINKISANLFCALGVKFNDILLVILLSLLPSKLLLLFIFLSAWEGEEVTCSNGPDENLYNLFPSSKLSLFDLPLPPSEVTHSMTFFSSRIWQRERTWLRVASLDKSGLLWT